MPLADRKVLNSEEKLLPSGSKFADSKLVQEDDARRQKLKKEAERKEMIKLSIINGNRRNQLGDLMSPSFKRDTLSIEVNQKPMPKTPNQTKGYNGNASDSEDEDVKMRNKVKNKYHQRGSQFNDDEKKIINYIIEKKSPVYGFVDFLSKKKKVSKPIDPKDYLKSTKGLKEGADLDIQQEQNYMSTKEVQQMMKNFNYRKQKEIVVKMFKKRLLKMSLRFFRTYFAKKVNRKEFYSSFNSQII